MARRVGWMGGGGASDGEGWLNTYLRGKGGYGGGGVMRQLGWDTASGGEATERLH